MSDFNSNPANWLPSNVPTAQDRIQMGRTVNAIVRREMGPFAAPPLRGNTLRSGPLMERIWNGQFDR